MKNLLLTTTLIASLSLTLCAQTVDITQRVKNLIDLTKHQDSHIRHYAQYSLEKEFGTQLPAVIEAYQQEKIQNCVQDLDHQNDKLVSNAKSELIRQGKRALPHLRTMLKSEQSMAKALVVLKKMGRKAKSLQIPVAKLVANHHKVQIRNQALVTLQAIAAPDQIKEETIALIQTSLFDKDMSQRQAVVRYVGKLGSTAHPFVPQVIKVLETTKSWRVQEEAIKTLGKIGEAATAAIPTLRKMNNFDKKHFCIEDVYISNAITKTLAKIQS